MQRHELVRHASGGAVAALLVATTLLAAGEVAAQSRRPSRPRPAAARPASYVPPAARADSVAMRGDTARALAILDSAVRVDRRDAEAWHRRGLIFWANARARRSAGIMPAETIKQLMVADTSLRMARQLEPDSARYALALGEFQLQSKFGITRFAATSALRDAADASARVALTAPMVAASASAQLAAVHVRRYQVHGHRLSWHIGLNPTAPMLDDMGMNPSELWSFVEYNSVPLESRDFSGELAYLQAEEGVAQALRVAPADTFAQRLQYALLADRGLWEELESHAARGRRAAPRAALPLLARGLALHRLSRRAEAEAAFDSALAMVTAEERARLTSVERLLRTSGARRGLASDSALYVAYTPRQRATVDSMYWALADPLALTRENEFRTEYLARVAFADIVWTAEEMGVRGADSERGDIYIRYGEPLHRHTVSGGEVWRYEARLAFVFLANPMFGTARLGGVSASRAELLRQRHPASFATTPLARRLDSVAVQIARFRVDASRIDSADVFVAGVIPVDSMLRGLDVRRTTMDVAFGVWTAEGARMAQDSARLTVTPGDAVNQPSLRSWRQRLPLGTYVYRVEAVQYDGLTGARARGILALEPAPTFGTSDLLLAAVAAPRRGVAAARWSDLAIAPSAGTVARGQPLALVWETYGLAPDADGTARHRVTVSVERRVGSKLSALAARVIGGVTGASPAEAGPAAVRFERAGASTTATVDWLTLDLGDARAGEYVARVIVEDLVAGTRATVERPFRVR